MTDSPSYPPPPPGWQPPPPPPPGWAPPPPPPPGDRRNWFIRHKALSIGLGVFVALLVIGALAPPEDERKITPAARPAASSDAPAPAPAASTAAPAPAPSTPAPTTQPPAPTAPVPTTQAHVPSAPLAAATTAAPPAAPAETSQQKIERRVRKVLGSSNRGVERVKSVKWISAQRTVQVVWAINDNLTEGLVKDSARLDAKEILEAVKDRGIPIELVSLRATFPLQDAYGNSKEMTVIRATFSGEVMNRINYEAVDFKKIYDLADSSTIVPAFQY